MMSALWPSPRAGLAVHGCPVDDDAEKGDGAAEKEKAEGAE